MATFQTSMAQGQFTKAIVAVYRERIKVMSFLRSFFPSVEAGTKTISVEVIRGTEKIAVDIARGESANRNRISKSTERVYEPPYYREEFDVTELDGYDRLFGSPTITESAFADLVNQAVEKLMELQAKIERAYELQCAQVLTTGIVTMNNGDNIDFKRKAAMLVDANASGEGGYWATNNDLFSQLARWGGLLRTVGKVQGGVFNLILGTTAKAHMDANTVFQARADIMRLNTMDIREPQRNSVGGTSHGRISAGDYTYNIYTYPEYYTDSSGVSTPYLDPKKIIILPEQTNFKMAFGAVPQLPTEAGEINKSSFVFNERRDPYDAVHLMDVKSAGVAIPVAVDQIFTAKVVTG